MFQMYEYTYYIWQEENELVISNDFPNRPKGQQLFHINELFF